MLKFGRSILALNLVVTVGLSTLLGCDGTPNGSGGGGSNASAGSIALVLQGGTTVNTFAYSITGPGAYSGSINVASSSTVSVVIGNIAAGSGYTLALTGTSVDGKTSCSGASTAFSVAAAATTPVAVTIDCHTAPITGGVLVNGTINVCPRIDAVSSSPPTGNVLAISSTAEDQDNGPQPLTYGWTTTSGTLSSATAQNPTLTCTVPGTVSLTLTASDGDPGCDATFGLQVTCPSDAALAESAWVEMGANNQAIARLLTPYTACPSITVDGVTKPMNVRAPAGTLPLRPTSTDTTLAAAMTSGNSKPSVFSNTACEFLLPAGATAASVAGIKLPLPKPVVNRVVVIGDTGCRISIGNVYQACDDPTIWPFSVISQAAAAMQPDLVLHVGDYQYRDNPCPPGNTA